MALVREYKTKCWKCLDEVIISAAWCPIKVKCARCSHKEHFAKMIEALEKMKDTPPSDVRYR
jgi:hypothetical protein